MQMVWEEPPARKQSEVQAMLEQLQANPGRWALVNTQRGAGGGTATWWKKHGCEATTRCKDGVVKTYARWPEPDPNDPQPAAAPSKVGRMSNAECDAILDARLEGATLDDLAERFGRAVATIRSAIHRAEDRRQKAEDTARPTPLVASQPKGTCRVCHAKNRGLTDGVCRLCIVRAKEKAALTEDGAA